MKRGRLGAVAGGSKAGELLVKLVCGAAILVSGRGLCGVVMPYSGVCPQELVAVTLRLAPSRLSCSGQGLENPCHGAARAGALRKAGVR